MTARLHTETATEGRPAKGSDGALGGVVEPGQDVSRSRAILGVRVDATSYEDATRQVVRWARFSESRYVCVATVNNVMEARDAPRYMCIMNEADLVTPDGMPLVWGLRWLGIEGATRVYGPDLTPSVLDRAAREAIPVGFYGGTPGALEGLVAGVRSRWPDVEIAYTHSPPFRELTSEEDDRIVSAIDASGVRILFVGLGCPKQETWMADHRGRVRAVMVGVGAAFDFLGGTKRQAPRSMQKSGLEWLFRLATEPTRLWKRYLRQNPRFALLFGAQLIRARIGRPKSRHEDIR